VGYKALRQFFAVYSVGCGKHKKQNKTLSDLVLAGALLSPLKQLRGRSLLVIVALFVWVWKFWVAWLGVENAGRA
jgi:hypothetical protein